MLAYGHMVKTALEAAELLKKQGVEIEVVNARFCKPLDEQLIADVCDRHDLVVTLEDHVKVGGFGSAVLECVAGLGAVRANVQVMGVPDDILVHMSRNQILEHCGLTPRHVAERFLVDREAGVEGAATI